MLRAIVAGVALGVGGLAILLGIDVGAPPSASPAPGMISDGPSSATIAAYLSVIAAGDDPADYAGWSNSDLQRIAYADPFAALLLAWRWRDSHEAVARELVVGAAIELDNPQPLRWWVRRARPPESQADLAALYHRYRLEALAVRLGADSDELAVLDRSLAAAALSDADWLALRRTIDEDGVRLERRRRR